MHLWVVDVSEFLVQPVGSTRADWSLPLSVSAGLWRTLEYLKYQANAIICRAERAYSKQAF